MHLFDIMQFGYKVGVDPTVTDFYEAMSKASTAAATGLSARLRYRTFDRYATRKEYFHITRTFGGMTTPHVALALSRGFADTSTMTIRYAANPLPLRNADADLYTNLKDLLEDGLSDQTMINGVAGLVSIFGVDLTDMWVEVAYSGGLYVSTDLSYDDVPDWLEELAMAQATIYLTLNKNLQPETPPDMALVERQIITAINQYGRFYPQAFKPDMTIPER